MARQEKKPVVVDRVACVNRLSELGALFADKPTFKVGDLITHNEAVYGPAYNSECEAHGVHPVMIVLAVDESWRSVQIRMGEASEAYATTVPESQAVFIAHADAGGSLVMRWVNAWVFKLAPPELLRAVPGGSLNH